MSVGIRSMALKDRISEAIAASDKSDADIAKACEVTRAAVVHWKNGDTKNLKGESAVLLEQATGFRAFWLLYGKGPKRTQDMGAVWPFPKIDPARLESLPPEDQGYVESRVMQAIEECERFRGNRQAA